MKKILIISLLFVVFLAGCNKTMTEDRGFYQRSDGIATTCIFSL